MSYSVQAINTSLSHGKKDSLRLGYCTQELKTEEMLIAIRSFQSKGIISFSDYSIEAISTSISLTKDKGLRLGFVTRQGITEDIKQQIIKSFQSFNQITFKPDEN